LDRKKKSPDGTRKRPLPEESGRLSKQAFSCSRVFRWTKYMFGIEGVPEHPIGRDVQTALLSAQIWKRQVRMRRI
jgi:hypothetical protein